MSESREDRVELLRARIEERLRERREQEAQERARATYTPPRYDEVFFEGVAWLNTL